MKPLVFAYLGTLISFFVIDGLWLGLIAKNFYRNQLGDLMLPSPNLWVAAIFYLIFAAAVVFLAVRPGLDTGSLMTRWVMGRSWASRLTGPTTFPTFRPPWLGQ